jgi:hypothetical protein
VRTVLDELVRGGMIREWARAGRYDSFVPTDLGQRRANTFGVVREGSAARESAAEWDATPFDGDGSEPGGRPMPSAERAGPPSDYDASLPARPAASMRPRYVAGPRGDAPLGRRPPLRRPGASLTSEAALNRLVEQLDEALVLLRAIHGKLGRDR